ncbi:MAG: multidrug efflux SMR transporter [Chitinophagaceae bacterium]
MGYLFLLLTIVSESAAVLFMKASQGFHHKGQAAIAVVAYILSFVFLTLALKHLPVGLANAIWAGTSTVLVALLGIAFFGERVTALQFVFLALIVIGLVGLGMARPTE